MTSRPGRLDRRTSRVASLLVAPLVVMLLSVGRSPAQAAAALKANQPPAGRVTWLAAGDSYSSGQGIAGTGVGTDTCAQSPLAYGPKAAALLAAQRQWVLSPVVFPACTGAVTGNFYNSSADQKDGTANRRSQWAQAQSKSSAPKFDVISMSFGGNDIGFSDILKDCLGVPTTWKIWNDPTWSSVVLGQAPDPQCHTSETEMKARVDAFLAGRPWTPPGRPARPLFGPKNAPMSLVDFYAQIAANDLSSRGVLVVVGYPELFAPSAQWGQWRQGECNFFRATDSDMLSRAADYFDAKLQDAVTQAADKSHRHIQYVSRIQVFDRGSDNHSLCSGTTEWLNGVSTGFWDGSLVFEHSFHPNDLGHLATAEEVASRLDQVMGTPPAPTATPGTVPRAPPITSGSLYNVGDRFDAQCVVAWPTAPVYTQSSISMTMSCQGVPQQFTLVNVQYGDPNLPINPSTGYVEVIGRIADIATSGYGFKELVVVASNVRFNAH